MKAIIFGSNGFFGEHLYKRLEKLGHQVLRGNREGDILEPVDILYDVAAYGNLYSHTDIHEILKANVFRVEKILKRCEEIKPEKIVLTSTSAVVLPVQTAYSSSKVLMECVAKQFDLPISIIRPHKPYGIGDSPEHLIPKVFRSCLEGEYLKIDPLPVHDYVWIDDYTELTIDPPLGRLEIGTGKPTSNIEIVTSIERITGKRANYELTTERRPYDTNDWYYKGPKLNLPTSLEEGLEKIYASIREETS